MTRWTRRRRGLAASILAGALALAPGGPAAAQPAPSRLDAILAGGRLRVGMPGDYAPFGVRDAASGAWRGLDVDEAAAMARALGVGLELVQTSWKALLPDLLAGKFDIGAGGVSVTLARQARAFYSAPLLRDGKTPIAACANADKFQTLSQIDRPGVRVLTNPGGTNEAFDRARLHAAEIVVFPDNTRIFDELAAGRGDLMITDATEAMLQHRLHPDLCALHPDHPFDVSEKAYLLPRDVPLQQWVDQFLHLQRESGELPALIAKWLQ
ncbi:MAG: transporter substrate-binding domain-containing protein [Rhodospirillales bacterium]|nr:transporter substrate-binding domain-containing protein [Rhodospirillales bacterium]